MLWFHAPDRTLISLYDSEHARGATDNHLVEPHNIVIFQVGSPCAYSSLCLTTGRQGGIWVLFGKGWPLFLLFPAAPSYSSALNGIQGPKQLKVTRAVNASDATRSWDPASEMVLRMSQLLGKQCAVP